MMFAVCSLCSTFSEDLEEAYGELQQTLQFLHRHTKFASPLLPDCSLVSCLLVSTDSITIRLHLIIRTKRLMDTQLGCISLHDVHWTLNV